MNADYCSNCGFKIEYGLHKPNFCPSCGTQVSTAAVPPKKVNIDQGEASPKEGQEDSYKALERLSKLAYEVDYGDGGYKKQTIGDIIQDESQGGGKKRKSKPIKAKEDTVSEEPPPEINAETSLKDRLDVVKESIADCSSAAHKFRDAEEDVV
jgi:hypothetical protein